MERPQYLRFFFLIFFLSSMNIFASLVQVGIEQLFEDPYFSIVQGKNIGLITNHTAISSKNQTTISLIKQKVKKRDLALVALFGPEHGIKGAFQSEIQVLDSTDEDGVPIYSLFGKTRRITPEMLKGIDILIFDIQDIGSRSYTYISTLFYAMEEAAKFNIPLVVLDRPNPINGIIIDGPLLDDEFRSFVGYINVPYCHGMTVGELSRFFNDEYQVNCQLTVVPMKGWERAMSFSDTGLTWVPTSPFIPEAQTPLLYPATGILGELQIVNIGIGYTLPFKVIGAPWIDAFHFASSLNQQGLPGVYFHPFSYCPFFGRFGKNECNGVLIIVTNPLEFKPVTTQFLIMGILKSLYPTQFLEGLVLSKEREEMFNKVNGTKEVLRILKEEKYPFWKLKGLHDERKKAFLQKRKKYLISHYL